MFKKKLYIFIFLISLILINNNQNAKEMLIYADDISYDQNKNIIAKGNAKVLYQNKIISSNLIIYSQDSGNITLPIDFSLKDEKNVFYYGTSGEFDYKSDTGTFINAKVLLNDGSRIVGKKITRNGKIDIITKGVYSPCQSRIKVANFLCPIWQLESEKMLHDYDKLFLYQKHSKMRILNTPVYYLPYLVTPSPLRKERKSGFLSAAFNLNFFDTKISHATSLPYYFNLDIDKELTFTPTINYGGGIDSNQRFNFDYYQLLSDGEFSSYLTFDTKFQNKNSEKWFRQGSVINTYKKNINEKYRLDFTSSLQTSKNYIQQTDPNNDLSYSSSLASTLNIYGYNLFKLDDTLNLNITNYQSNQNNENNKTLPTILPFVTFYSGKEDFKKYTYSNTLEGYNIFRDESNEVHAKKQIKLSSKFSIDRGLIKYGTRINYGAEFYNQLFNTENKKIENDYRNSNYFRSFPILGIGAETPFKFKNNFKNLTYKPQLSLVLSPGMSNSEKISNEDSSINSYTIGNNYNYNRYTGSDKLDNSKRINLNFNVSNKNFDGRVSQSYEFTNNSNYHYTQGNEKKLSDLLGEFNLKIENLQNDYNFRFDPHENYMKSQSYGIKDETKIGTYEIGYLDEKSKTGDIVTSDKKTLNYILKTAKYKYSQISYSGLYDLQKSINTESSISYSYFDECFGINIDFQRNSYSKEDLKPQDMMTIMFSFKNLGSYQSTNLAVSETDKQDIRWESDKLDNELFN